jgi:hypothetical protein
MNSSDAFSHSVVVLEMVGGQLRQFARHVPRRSTRKVSDSDPEGAP